MMSPVALTSVVALLCSLLVTLCSAAGALPAPPSYPVFGTKRYTRGNLIPTSEYGSGVSGGALSGALGLPVYHRLPSGRYYDAPLTSPQYFPFAPYQQPPSSTVDYYDDTGYYGDGAKSFYYLPPPPPPPQPQHRRYQRNNERYTSYGLPTYRGEYKPTPYYYAHGPSYSYTDDHESSNPLDDLHEEMLQEDERERALDYYPVGQEQWYESPSRPDSAFLRNLILYNQQLQNYGRGMPMQQQQQQQQQLRSMIDGSSEDDFEDYDEPEPDYEYEGAIADPEPGYDGYYGAAGYAAPVAAGGARYEANGGSAASNNRDALSKLSSLRSSMVMNQIDDEDDEEVQELKSLIHQQKSSQQRLPPMFVDKMAPFVLKNQQYPAPPTPSSSYQKQHPAQYQIQQQQQQQKQAQEQLQRQQQQQQQRQKEQQQKQLLQQQQQQQQQLFQEQQREQQRLKELQLQQQQKQERELKQQQLLRTLSSDYQAAYEPTDNWQKDSPSYNAYDYDNEYDDGSWSHWDRKRNVQPKKATFASKTTSPVTTTTTTKTKATTTVKPAAVAVPTSTTSAPVTIKPVAHQPGQKEVVLPRPTNPRNVFSASLLNAVAPSTAHQQQQQQQQHGVMKVDESSMAKQIKSSKIYDTIKAMVNMRQHMEDADLRQQLEHQKQLAHIRKRFVSNEESLVQQLDGLKRSA